MTQRARKRGRHPNQDAALARARAATQFQPLDPSSPTVLVQVRVPRATLDRIDAARGPGTRSEWIRAAIDAALG